MAEFTKVDRLKVWLDQSGLKQDNFNLWQVISVLIDVVRQGQVNTQEIIATPTAAVSSGITSLTTDVVAAGPGAAVATIQPSVVTYSKIQNATQGNVLLGRDVGAGVVSEITLGSNLDITTGALRLTAVGSDVLLGKDIGPGVVEEITLGANLSLVSGSLEINTSGGGSGGGLAHNLLSATHPDTLPAAAVIGDLIYAGPGVDLAGEYYGCYLNAPVVENFVGIRAGYMAGYQGLYNPTNSMGYGPPAYDFITVAPINHLLAIDYIDAFLLAKLVEDFIGIRNGYTTNAPVVGNFGAYAPPALNFIVPASPANPTVNGQWRRRPIGTSGQVLTVTSGAPIWATLPSDSYLWYDIAFNAANFAATGGTTPTWTLTSGDQTRFQYQQFPGVWGVGVNVRIAALLETTSVGGTAPTRLEITLPFNMLGRYGQYISILENGLAPTVIAYYDANIASNKIFVEKIASAVFDTTPNATYLSFELSAVLMP